MRLREIGLIAALAVGVALPAGAQTTQTTPQKSTDLSIPTSPSTAKSAAANSGGTPATGLVDINSASSADLDALPGVGKSRATVIIKNRPYKGKDELLSRHILPANVYNGIKSKIIAKQG